MAMLAEPRRKQKLSLDPRNRMWSDDQNKFGKRMLEKMGWQSGKGLGANEDGKTDHIKVSLKNNTLGVGCTPSHDDNWIAHQDDFNDILATLNQDHSKEDSNEDKATVSDDATSKSLEERSKKSRSRVHYKKFTRGKDFSRYGATDINCILGVRATKSAPTTPRTQSANNSDSESENEKATKEDEHEDTSHGVTTIVQNTSIQDYFARKMAELKKGRPLPQQQTKDSESDGKDSKDEDSVEDDGGSESKTKKKKKKSKRKFDDSKDDDVSLTYRGTDVDGVKSNKSPERNLENVSVDQGGEEGVNIVSIELEDDQPRKKKCKRKKRDEELEQVSIEERNISGSSSKKK
ncbi:PIN2/TERF1-interacting telomerase inhibitor 1-like [Amphiura filiformis]|uniref:PIN2/TERF1-interacting telomerase inhibitor 1-like n=1 Tax=Amphiura filiformis TaxID=82378 RepID=UPI003B2225FD